MKFVKLTDTGGRDVWIVPQWVTKVTAPVPGAYGKNALTVVWMGGNAQAVQEPPEAVVGLLADHDPADG